MKIPIGHTEADVIEAVEKCVAILAPLYVFGSWDAEDLKQQGWVFAIEVLETEKYDPARNLAGFLFAHIRNRLSNHRRNLFRRNDYPCSQCAEGTPCAQAEGAYCEKFRVWLARNQAKANIASPVCIDGVGEDRGGHCSPIEEDVAVAELVAMVDANLPVELRTTYLQMRAGVSVSKARRLEVEAAVKEIIKCL